MYTEETIKEALEQWFEHDGFRDGQYAPVEAVVNGRDAVVIMPTGSGKSLCYQLAALILPGTTLVISPLIALMKDQVDALARRKIPATFLNSSVPLREMDRRLDHMAAGDYKLVYLAPERFRNASFMRALAHTRLSLLAVDEAHCISQWGHDFRPDYLQIRNSLSLFPDVRIMAVTATATPDVRADIIRQLRLGETPRAKPYVQVQGFSRPNLNLSVSPCRSYAEKLEHVARLVRQQHTGIVYVATRKHAQTVFEKIAALGRDLGESTVLLYHGALSDTERVKVQNAFAAAKYPVVVATNAFGMGVDRADLRFIAHWDIPGSIEAYYQEVGRAGRDGLTAWCELLFNYADVRTQQFFIDKKVTVTPEEHEEMTRRDNDRLRRMIRYCDTAGCRHAFILSYFGESVRGDVCGGCDHCGPRTAPAALTDPQWTIVQKVLSCIGRMKGIGDCDRVCEVLLGEKTTFVTRNGLDKLSTFDLLHGFDPDILGSLLATLVRAGCAVLLADQDNAVRLTAKGVRVAKHEEKNFTLRWPVPATPATPRTTENRFGSAPVRPSARTPLNFRLSSELRTWRKDIAGERGLPAFRIMTNKTLDAIAAEQPTSLSALSRIYGIKTFVLDEYAQDLLDIVSDCR